MQQVRNMETRILDINLGGGKVITLLPGLNAVDDELWKKALPLKWTAKLFGREALQGPTELDGVKLWEKPKDEKAKASKTKKGSKAPENFG